MSEPGPARRELYSISEGTRRTGKDSRGDAGVAESAEEDKKFFYHERHEPDTNEEFGGWDLAAATGSGIW